MYKNLIIVNVYFKKLGADGLPAILPNYIFAEISDSSTFEGNNTEFPYHEISLWMRAKHLAPQKYNVFIRTAANLHFISELKPETSRLKTCSKFRHIDTKTGVMRCVIRIYIGF